MDWQLIQPVHPNICRNLSSEFLLLEHKNTAENHKNTEIHSRQFNKV